MWRYSIASPAATGTPASLASGTISFDTAGRAIGAAPVTVTVPRVGTGASTPLTFDLSFADGAGGLSALTDEPSTVFARGDGSSFGVLVGFGVDRDGVIVGSFDNGEQRALGQVVLASFANEEGLVDEGSNLFRVGPASGAAAVTTPGLAGTGRVLGGALELSNVDLGQEFIKMIMTSTGYTASSRVIRTTDELMQQLLVLGR
jgi:flagellar hook protein FlgE